MASTVSSISARGRGRPRRAELPRYDDGRPNPNGNIEKARRLVLAGLLDDLRLDLGFGVLSTTQWDLLVSAATELRREPPKSKAKKKARAYSDNDMARFQRNWRAANPERAKQTGNRRRELMKGGVTQSQIRTWAKAQAKICRWCETSCEADYQVDHVFPLARGGEHQLHNLCIACRSCNLSKGAQYPEEFELKIFVAKAG